MGLVQLTSSRSVARAVAFSAVCGLARKVCAYGVMVVSTTRLRDKCTKKNEKNGGATLTPAGSDLRRNGGAARGRTGDDPALGDPPDAESRHQGFLELGHRKGEHAVVYAGLELREIEAEPEPQA